MDIEAEADRRVLCDKILNQIDMFQTKQAMKTTGGLNATLNQSIDKTQKANASGGKGRKGNAN